MNKEDETLIKTFFSSNSYANNTRILYELSLRRYSQFHQLSLEELIQEAEKEEEQGIRKRRRRIKSRITAFKVQLEEEEHKSLSTVKNYISAIRTFYDFYDVTPPKIKFPKGMSCLDKNYGRLLKREDIRKMCDAGSTRARAVIYTLALTGLSQAEMRNLTIAQLLTAASQVLKQQVNTVEEFINLEEKLNDEILTLHITREKVHHRYFTFLPPEATRQIIAYLRERISIPDGRLHPSNPKTKGKLFLTVSGNPMSVYSARMLIIRCGRNAGFQTSEEMEYSYWRGHALRKYFISTIKNKTGDSELAEWLAGHKPPYTDETYWYKDEEDIKKRYIKALEYLSIDEGRINSMESPEYREVMKHLSGVRWVLDLLDEDPIFREAAKKAWKRKRLDSNIDSKKHLYS